MRLGWIRILALIGVAALFANAQCYGACVSTASPADAPPAKSCHQHKSSHEDSVPCPHRYADLSAPEAGIAKIKLDTTGAAVPFVLIQDSSGVDGAPQFLPLSDAGRPPGGGRRSLISILRI